MLAEGIFILTVSLSGNYDDLEFVGYFNDCPTAIQYFKENCSDIRNSRVFSLHKELTKLKIKVDLFDPHADRIKVEKKHKIIITELIYNIYI